MPACCIPGGLPDICGQDRLPSTVFHQGWFSGLTQWNQFGMEHCLTTVVSAEGPDWSSAGSVFRFDMMRLVVAQDLLAPCWPVPARYSLTTVVRADSSSRPRLALLPVLRPAARLASRPELSRPAFVPWLVLQPTLSQPTPSRTLPALCWPAASPPGVCLTPAVTINCPDQTSCGTELAGTVPARARWT